MKSSTWPRRAPGLRRGLKRLIPNVVTFEAEGFLWGNVNRVPDSALNSILSGRSLLEALADGNLLKASGNMVYVMEEGAKRRVRSPAVMETCGYGWEAIRTISDAALSGIPGRPSLSGSSCPRFAPPDGTLLQGSGDAIYVVDAGRKRRVASMLVFRSCGYLAGDINLIADSTLAGIANGKNLKSSTCL